MKNPFAIKKGLLLGSVLASLLGVTANGSAADIFWDGTDGPFGTAGNWLGDVAPTADDSANIDNGGTARIVAGNAFSTLSLNLFSGNVVQTGGSMTTTGTDGRFLIGGVFGQTSSYIASSDAMLIGGDVRIGMSGGSGVVTLSDSASYFGDSGQDTLIGDGAESQGTLNLSGTAQWNINGDQAYIGRGGNGTLNMSGHAAFSASGIINIADNLSVVNASSTGSAILTEDATLSTTARLYVSNGANSNATLTLSDRAIASANDYIVIGRMGGTGSATVSGDAQMIKTGVNDIIVGDHAGSNGSLLVSDRGAVTTNNRLRVGNGGATGTMTIKDTALISVGNEFWIGNGGGSNGTVNMESGTLDVTSWVAVGRDSGTGTLNMSGGTLTHSGSGSVRGDGGFNGDNFTTAGIGTGAQGFINHTGGVINNVNSVLVIGESGTVDWKASGGTANLGVVHIGFSAGSNGTLTLSGNANYTATDVVLSSNGAAAGGTGRLNLKGGTLTAASIKEGAGNAGSVHFDGGTLKAAASNADFFAGFEVGKLVLDAAGMIFDSNGNDVTVTQGLTGEGGVIKRGEGLLNLAGNSTYLGNTSVENGTLLAGAAFFGDFSTISLSGDGVIDLAFLGTDFVALLNFDGVFQEAGTWGGIGSGADHISEHFTGTGTITVAAVPEPSTFVLLAGGAGFVSLMMRRKRSA
jgi:T5SS/PEP-CTERM-associated repeat protein/autotransporter-associated beta strand protein